MKKILKIFLGVLFAALLLGTFWFLWQKTRPVKVVYTIVQPKLDTLKQYVSPRVKSSPATRCSSNPRFRVSFPTSTRRPGRWFARAK